LAGLGLAAAVLAGLVGCASTSPQVDNACAVTPSPLVSLPAGGDCDKCRDLLLPGRAVPHSRTAYTIWSNLPEVFCSPGVFYSTVGTLPPDSNGNPSASMRKQVRDQSFAAVNDAFDIFLFHTIHGCADAGPRRIVVYVRNVGTALAILYPRQILISDGVVGQAHEMESTVGRRVLEDDWDRPIFATAIEPGDGAVVAYSKQFGMQEDGPDSSRNVNCFGRVRVRMDERTASRLDVYVIALEAAPVEENASRAEALLDQTALSGEKHIDFNTRPSGCQVRRATGVFRSFVWRNDPFLIDADALSPEGLVFPMALWDLVTEGCPDARQTVDLLLHPEYTRSDTIGNYMVDYRIQIQLVNRNSVEFRRVDLRFGKSDADIGIAWRVANVEALLSDSDIDVQPVRTGWAGPKQDGMTRSFLEFDGGPITLRPCETRSVGLHFLVLGNSSLPFDLRVVPVSAAGP